MNYFEPSYYVLSEQLLSEISQDMQDTKNAVITHTAIIKNKVQKTKLKEYKKLKK